MTIKTPTRDLLIRVGMDIISEYGYNATGINSVLKSAGVPKGSFYHYFASKEAFGLAVIEAFAEEYDARLESMLVHSSSPPLERLQGYFASVRSDMALCDHTKGCLVGNLGQEMSAQSDQLRDALDRILRRWEGHFADCIREGQSVGSIRDDITPEALASFILAGWQGAVLRAKTVKTCEPMQCFEHTLLQCVAACADR